MNLAAVMDEIAAQLEEIPDLVMVSAFPASTVTAPAAVVGYPQSIDFDQTARRGFDRIRELPVQMLFGLLDDLATRDQASAWASGGGPASVKALLEARRWESCDVLTVSTCEFGVVLVAGVSYLAATFSLDIFGSGTL